MKIVGYGVVDNSVAGIWVNRSALVQLGVEGEESKYCVRQRSDNIASLAARAYL